MIKRLKIYKETRSTIRTGKGLTGNFVFTKGVRQGCVMSPSLFNLYMDIDGEFKKRGIGGLSLGKQRIWLLAYADDKVILAKHRVALIDMLDTLGRFLRKRDSKLNVIKQK